jgi:Branched-chain amino acid transport protein (AzlD)
MTITPALMEQYITLILVAVVPTGIWRIAGVLLSRRISNQSEIFEWVRFVATALLAGVVAKLLGNPSDVLALAPLWARIGAIFVAFIAFMLCKRSVLIGVVVGETILITSVYLQSP